MRYWYGYTGKTLLLGQGNAVQQIVSHGAEVRQILDAADAYYARYGASHRMRRQTADAATFTAALAAPLAVRALKAPSSPPLPFSSAGEMLRLFGNVPVQQAAINLYNGRTASAWATENSAEKIAARVRQGYDTGELLLLPRDAAQLHAPPITAALPGALSFLLARAQAERKAFEGYLRHGTRPEVSKDMITAITKSRPTLGTREVIPQ